MLIFGLPKKEIKNITSKYLKLFNMSDDQSKDITVTNYILFILLINKSFK